MSGGCQQRCQLVWRTDNWLSLCRAGEARQRQQGADSYIGAIMDVCDADDGEVVEEDGMFDMVYSGHCNKQGCKEVRSMQFAYQDLHIAPCFFAVLEVFQAGPLQRPGQAVRILNSCRARGY